MSDASAPLKYQNWSPNNQLQIVLRIWDVASDQLNNLRVRDLFQNVISKGQGAYLKIGTTTEEIVSNCHIPPVKGKKLIAESLSPEEVISVHDYPTTIATPSFNDFHKIVRHGYEVAKCISVCYDGLLKKTWT